MSLKRVYVVAACLMMLSCHHAMATCSEQEQACKNRCGSGSQYNFDCDDSKNGAAFSCSCTGSGGWVEVNNDVPLDRSSTVGQPPSQSRCDEERASCETSCPQGTVPEFTCENKKSGSSVSLASACACTTPGGSTSVNATATTDGDQATSVPSMDVDTTTCEEARSVCTNSCPEGLVADFKCENSSSATGGSFAVASACACVAPQQNDDTATPSPQGETPTGGSTFEPSKIQSQQQAVQQATDAGFTMGAQYVIHYLTVILAALDQLV